MNIRLILGLLLLVVLALLWVRPEKDAPDVLPEPIPVIIPDEPETKFELLDFPKLNNKEPGDTLYAEIMNRTNRPWKSEKSFRSTEAHETVHGIHADLRNKNNGLRAFYVTPDKYFLIRDAKFPKSQIINYVPNTLKYDRFYNYVVKAPAWESSPLYIFDEWTAYINGAEVAVDDAKRGQKESENYDTVMGSLEFSIYAVATCMAIVDNDPELWNDNEFREFVKLNIKRAEKVFNEGKEIFPYPTQNEMLDKLRNSQEAEPLRLFIQENLQGVFLDG